MKHKGVTIIKSSNRRRDRSKDIPATERYRWNSSTDLVEDYFTRTAHLSRRNSSSSLCSDSDAAELPAAGSATSTTSSLLGEMNDDAFKVPEEGPKELDQVSSSSSSSSSSSNSSSRMRRSRRAIAILPFMTNPDEGNDGDVNVDG